MNSRFSAIVVCFLLSAAAPVGAHPGGASPASFQTQESRAFEPPPPGEDSFDWILLTSGEWLKGEILRLRGGKLEFDSDKLGELKLDWDGVAEVRSPRPQTILLESKETHLGTLLVKDGQVVLGGEDGGRFDRADLLAIVPGEPSEWNYWSGKVSLGLAARRGNTSQTDFTSYLFTRRETAATRWDTTYNGAFSKTQGVETANNHRLNSRFDYFLTHRLFVTPLSATGYRDPFTNIDLRVTPSAGFGYDLVDRNTLSWEVGAGPAYQYTKYISVTPGESREEETWAAFLKTSVEWDITPDTELKFGYDITVPLPDTNEYNHHLSTVLSLDLLGALDLDVTFVWDRVNKPLANESGVAPKPDDLRLSVGLGFDF